LRSAIRAACPLADSAEFTNHIDHKQRRPGAARSARRLQWELGHEQEMASLETDRSASTNASRDDEGPRRLSVLIADDEKNIRSTLRTCLESADLLVTEASSIEHAQAACKRQRFDLAFVDLRLGPSNGLTLIAPLLASNALMDVIVITAYGTVENAVDAIQLGASDVLQKPFLPAQIRELADKASRRRQLTGKLDALRGELDRLGPEIDFESRSPLVHQLLAILAKAAQRDVSVLLRGENGTGKSVLARQLHRLSPRAAKPLVVVNCPTLSEELLASELFGHARGAFTGAVRDQPGRVEAAQGGTLFLDEVGEIPPGLQAKLLRFLQERQFERVGESETRTADVRIIAATNRDLEQEVKVGQFRQDLLFRLNTFELVVPSLRARSDDIVALARRFLACFSANGPRRELSLEAEAALLAYEWPGNLRELRNAMERAAILAGGTVVGPELLPERIQAQAPTPRLGGKFTLDEIERDHIQRILATTTTVEEAAHILGIDTSTLWRRRKRWEQE
jgi:two-component system, NtrC family, response regulator AlgB